jgi:uncharacterized protein (TIGR00369 family)
MSAKQAGFEERVRESFARQRVMRTLNVSILGIGSGRVSFAMPFAADFTQQHGFLHAGTVATVLDSACGYAAFTLMPPDAAVLTIEFKANFLAPAKGSRFRFEGSVVKAGRVISVCDAHAFADQDGKEKMIASMTATIMTVTGRTGVEQ